MASAASPSFTSSSCLEKVLEHQLIAGLTTALWLRGIRDFEVLRGEVDSHGHDLVIEVNGVIRHIQLKAMADGGKRRDVSINVRLASKPSGCVVWMVYDPASLSLGPFYWFGGKPGEPLPPLGERSARHTKGNSEGVKAERAAHRLVSRSRFVLVEDISGLVDLLFDSRRKGPVPLNEGPEQLALLRRFLTPENVSGGPAWVLDVASGSFDAIPADLQWDTSVELAHLIDGYGLVENAGWGNPFEFAEARLARAAEAGEWVGGTAELWASLLFEHRRWRMAGIEPHPEAKRLLDRLCASLVIGLRYRKPLGGGDL